MDEKEKEGAGHDFIDADQPILHAEKDLLHRGPFVAQLAKAIRSWRGDYSLVVGLCGPWGCGKTSIKNLVLEALAAGAAQRSWWARGSEWLLRRKAAPARRLVEFNPWEWSGSGQVARSFFDELGGALGHGGAGRAFRRFARRLVPTVAGASFVGQGLALVLAILALCIAVLDAGARFAPVRDLRAALGLTGGTHLAAFAVIALAFAAITRRLKEIPSAADAAGAGASLADLKRGLEKKLRASTGTTLVVIDDVDRLTPDETRLLFRLVRGNANLPRLTYLLLFQHDLVAKALEPDSGAAFLQKIVQVQLDVPAVGRRTLSAVLSERLEKLLGGDAADPSFDGQRWAELLREGLSDFFKNLRDVKRFLAVFEFHLGVFKSGGVLEVSPVDLAALEALRMFSPEVWLRVRDSRELLLPNPMLMAVGGSLQEKADSELRAITANQPRQEQTEKVLSLLFPAAARAWGQARAVNDELARLTLRVCHADLFGRYFRLYIAPDEIRHAEVLSFVKSGSDLGALEAGLERMRSDGRLAAFLRVLAGRADRVPPAPGLPLVQALCNVLDGPLPGAAATPEPFSLPPLLVAANVLHRHAKRIRDKDKRFAELARAFKECRGLYLPALMIATEMDAGSRQRNLGEALVTPEQAKELSEAWVAKIQEVAGGEPGFLARPNAAYLLGRWHDWAEGDEFAKWLQSATAGQEGLFALLRAFLAVDRRYGGPLPSERARIDLKGLAAVTDIEVLRARIAQLDRTALSQPERGLLAIFDQSPENPMTEVGWIEGTGERAVEGGEPPNP